jgi:ABC-type phosphate transport system permease subunit
MEENLKDATLLNRKNQGWLSAVDLKITLFPALNFILALSAAVVGTLCFLTNRLDNLQIPLLGLLSFFLQILFVDVYRNKQEWDFKLVLISLLSFTFLLLLRWMPEFISGWLLNTVIDRSLLAGIFLLVSAVLAMSVSLYYLLGASPQAEDYSRYPLILTPVLLAISVYFYLLAQLFANGMAHFNLDVLFRPYYYFLQPVKTYIAGDWPKWVSGTVSSEGLLNYFLGTGLLVLLTACISLPFGVGTGVFLSEYGNNIFGSAARFTVTSLRAISLLILGMTAYTLTRISSGTALDAIIHGTFFTGFETRISQGGSFFTASIVLSLLVIPIIARATEEGCRSLPSELREGSLALGASEDTTLWRIIIPWALPNIVTGLLLGSAEAAGSTAVLLFIAGRGDYGVGVFKQVTSLAFMIFDSYYGDKLYKGAMAPYQFTAGMLLVIITVGLGLLSMLIKHWLVKRHRGG